MNEVLFSLEDHIAEITINRPEKSNALNAAARTGLFEAFRKAEDDPRCRVVILTGAGERCVLRRSRSGRDGQPRHDPAA